MRKIILSTILLMLTTIMLASCSGNADARQADTFKFLWNTKLGFGKTLTVYG